MLEAKIRFPERHVRQVGGETRSEGGGGDRGDWYLMDA